jgi:hypothetical protein
MAFYLEDFLVDKRNLVSLANSISNSAGPAGEARPLSVVSRNGSLLVIRDECLDIASDQAKPVQSHVHLELDGKQLRANMIM